MSDELQAWLDRGRRAQQAIDDILGCFTCPRCGRTSRHPNDIAEGYCGACHDWTRPGHDPSGGSSPQVTGE